MSDHGDHLFMFAHEIFVRAAAIHLADLARTGLAASEERIQAMAANSFIAGAAFAVVGADVLERGREAMESEPTEAERVMDEDER